MNLYEVAAEYKVAYDALISMDDINNETIKKTLSDLSEKLEDKAINTAAYIKNLEDQARAIRLAKENMHSRLVNLEQKLTSLKNYLRDAMIGSGVSKISSSPIFEILIRKNPPHVSIVNEEELPEIFLIKKEVVQIDKDMISRVLKAGKHVPGAELKQDMRLVIK